MIASFVPEPEAYKLKEAVGFVDETVQDVLTLDIEVLTQEKEASKLTPVGMWRRV